MTTQGQGAGEPFEVLPWERRFLGRAFDVDGDAALSVGRGNGKTTLAAAIADAVLRGPLQQPRAECVVVASSFDQARLTFDHVLAFGDYRDRSRWRINDTANRASVEDRDTGSRVRCVGSDPRRAHGLAPALVLADEPAQWEPNKADAMYAALLTAMGKIPGARMVAFGTRPASADHWFGKLLAGGAEYAQIHAARPDDPIGHRRTWLRANPSLDFMPALEARIRKEAAGAKADPSLLASFRSLRLNLGTADTEQALLLDAGTWSRIEAEAAVIPAGRYVLGLDLGGSAAMSAAAGYWPDDGFLDAVAVFAEEPSLLERGLQDGVARTYLAMHERGELFTAGLYVADVRALLAEVLRRWGPPAAIVADRYREAELRQVLAEAKFPQCALIVRGQGYRDGGEDVRGFRRACGEGRVRPVESLLLRAAMSGARTVSDPAGNAKLAKSTQGGRKAKARDDAAAAAILAVAEGSRRASTTAAPARRHAVVR